MAKIAIAGVIGAFLIFYIMTSPDQAAHIATGTGHFVDHLAHGIARFVNKLAS